MRKKDIFENAKKAELVGSEKQIKWAEDLRSSFIANIFAGIDEAYPAPEWMDEGQEEETDRLYDFLVYFIEAKAHASWWIDHCTEDGLGQGLPDGWGTQTVYGWMKHCRFIEKRKKRCGDVYLEYKDWEAYTKNKEFPFIDHIDRPDWMPDGEWNGQIYGMYKTSIYVNGEKIELSDGQEKELIKWRRYRKIKDCRKAIKAYCDEHYGE